MSSHGGRRGVILRLVGADDILEQPVAVRIVAGDDDVLEVRAFLDQLLEFRKQRLRHHQAFGAAVGQHEAVIVLGEQRVDRHGDDAGLEAAEKRGRPVDGVEQRQQHALFAVDAEAAQRRAEARHTVGQLAVGQRAARIDIGRLVGAAGGEIALQHVGGEVVIAWDLRPRALAALGACRARFGDWPLFFLPRRCVLCPQSQSLQSARIVSPHAKASVREPMRMIFSRDRILTTHVGSLPRNEKLSDLLVRQEAGEKFDAAEMAAEMDKAVRHVVEKQASAGIDIGNDGEQQRVGFQTYVPQRMSGFGGVSKRRRGTRIRGISRAGGEPDAALPACQQAAERAGMPERIEISRPQADRERDRALQEDRAGQIRRAVHDRALARHHFDRPCSMRSTAARTNISARFRAR